jgi:hypothetical protein
VGGAGFEDLEIGDKEDVSGNEMIEELRRINYPIWLGG